MVHAMIEQKQYSVAKIWFSRHRSQTPLGTFFVHKHSIFLIIFLVEIVMLWKNKLSDNYGTNHRDFIHQISGVQNLPHSCENFSLQSKQNQSYWDIIENFVVNISFMSILLTPFYQLSGKMLTFTGIEWIYGSNPSFKRELQ